MDAKGTFAALVVLGNGAGAMARRTVFRTLLVERSALEAAVGAAREAAIRGPS